MTQPLHSLSELVIHKLIKDQHGPASIELRVGGMPVTAAAQRLVDHVAQLYADRLGKGYGRFEEDDVAFPMSRFVHEYAVEERCDFATLTQRMMEHLQQCADQEPLATGGYVLIARVSSLGADCLLVVLITEAVGTAITAALDVADVQHLDLANIRVAGRIDLTAWQSGAERYISFLKGRGDVAGYFKQFLGCNDVVIALKETQKLVQGLSQFAEAQQMEPAARDQLMERAHGYLDELGDHSTPFDIDVISRQVWPEAPERLQTALRDERLELANGFVPDRRALKPLVRFKAAGPQWKLEFDRSSLRSGAVFYDRSTDTLVLSNLPEHLKRSLLDHLG